MHLFAYTGGSERKPSGSKWVGQGIEPGSLKSVLPPAKFINESVSSQTLCRPPLGLAVVFFVR